MSTEGGGGKRRRLERVCIFPDGAVAKIDEHDENVKILSVPHPASGIQTKILCCTSDGGEVDDAEIYEIQRFADKVPRSWFVNNSVFEAGDISLCTSLDPILLILPLLQKKQSQPKFLPLDQILDDKDCSAFAHLERCGKLGEALANVCDVRGEGQFRGFRLNSDLLMEYLKKKVDRVAVVLGTVNYNMSSTAAESTQYARSTLGTNSSQTHAQQFRFAFGLVAEYLHEDLAKKLQEFLGLISTGTASSSSVKKESGKNFASVWAEKEKANPLNLAKQGKKKEPTTLEKKMSKIDKSGMKSMSSFFTKKPAKGTKKK
eukprot:m.42254 g.42254  ORF g.42254 m.42254 type:complete len:317 (-) comp19046_c0_seq1:140-1090(-)